MLKIETFCAPGCERCAEVRDALKSVAEAFGADCVSWREVDVLKETDYAVQLGVMSPPSIAINGELVFPALPSPERLRRELERRLANSASTSSSAIARHGT